ncbi:SMC-Scp complex subunit ScpB [Jeotgalibacillus campisalis]|uniref:Segregation and condensation protein B n=1 Tax=Jeotgalibacillus campisalis TaxID=220754 RepID=A0A0C2S272_9BACL|nr:SMC-Scp complex subunit ScpB [Jeotgalibacillus campisalis]KIL48109.1 segregation and condensation protein B [Jeotgalibacillus campisalis]
MHNHDIDAVIESLLFAAGDEGLSISQLSAVLDISMQEAEITINRLKESYADQKNRGIHIVELAGAFQLATKREMTPYIKKLVESPVTSTLSQAALETLAIVAYRQPITRMTIEEIRGVKTDRPLHTLVSKGLIKEAGRAEGAGRAILYGTTHEFLDYFGLNDLSQLPALTEDIDGAEGEEETDLFFKSLQSSLGADQPADHE